MIVVRPTASLAKRMGTPLKQYNSPSSTVLGDWYAAEMVLSRRQYILCLSEHARLSVVLSAAPYATFPQRLPNALATVLSRLGVSAAAIARECEQMRSIILAKTINRSLLGTLKEFRSMLEYQPQDDALAMSLYLAETISMSLPERFPVEAAHKLFSQPTRARAHLRLV